MSTLEIIARAGHPDFLDLDWDSPLRSWAGGRLVDVARGVSRHVVRFVDYDGVVYAVKETTPEMAKGEYALLRGLADRGLPVVEAVGVVLSRGLRLSGADEDGPGDAPPAAALITKHLSFSMPYRYLFQGRGEPNLRNQLLDALSVLLVRLHLEGFFWGDCSLSNALFRRDAGALTAYLVDAETGVLNDHRLSDGQRSHDLSIATENVGGELLDLAAGGRLPDDVDPEAISEELLFRYERLWAELNEEEIVENGDRHQLDARTRRLNALGFDIGEYRLRTSADGRRVSVVPRVVEVGHHRKRLAQLTGIEADENQARRLLNSIEGHRSELELARGGTVPDALVAYDWLNTVYTPTIAAIPADLHTRLPDAEAFHQILEHRWYLSEAAGIDVGLEAAVQAYLADILPFAPVEESILPDPQDSQDFLDENEPVSHSE
jgi:hypothetical protein